METPQASLHIPVVLPMAAVRQENGQRTLGVVKRVYDNGVKDADGNIVDDTIDRDAEEAFVSGGTVTLPDDATNVWTSRTTHWIMRVVS